MVQIDQKKQTFVLEVEDYEMQKQKFSLDSSED